MTDKNYKIMKGGGTMKKIFLVLILILVFTIPVFAGNYITGYVEFNDSETGIYTDYLELYLEHKASDNLTYGLTLDLNEINTINATSVDAALDLVFAKGQTLGIAAGMDVPTSSFTYIKGKILNYSLGDDITFNAKARYAFGDETYWAVANLIFNPSEKVNIIVEARTDSNGYVPYSFGAQLIYAITEDFDLTVGYEINGFDAGINEWGAVIEDDSNTTYIKATYRF